MPLVESPGFAHLRLTVTDIGRSKAFYDEMFGWPAVIDMSSRVDEPGVRTSPADYYGGVIYATPSGALLGLRPVGTDRFESERTGLDHASFQVRSRSVLEDALEKFEQAGVEHGEIIDFPDSGLAILSFSDPDGLHLELCAPLG